MFGTRVNPLAIKAGDSIAVKFDPNTLEIKKVESCPGKPECVHLDHECYDSRFSTVVRKN